DHRSIHRLAETSFGPIFQFAQNERGNFRRRENLVAKLYANDVLARGVNAEWKELQFALHVCRTAPHQPLHRKEGPLRLRQQTPPRRLANDNAAIGIQTYDGWTKRAAQRARDTPRLPSLRIDVCDETVGGAQVYADDFRHNLVAHPFRGEGFLCS